MYREIAFLMIGPPGPSTDWHHYLAKCHTRHMFLFPITSKYNHSKDFLHAGFELELSMSYVTIVISLTCIFNGLLELNLLLLARPFTQGW